MTRTVTSRRHQSTEAGLSDHVGNTFVQSVSHDLRAPLASIQMAAAFLREQPVAAETQNAMLADIESKTEWLRHLVSDLLDLSRLDAGILSPRRQRMPADDLVYAALNATSLDAETNRVVVDIHGEPPIVDVDETLIRQALVNVLHNAARFSPNSPITITVEAAGRFCRVAVSDHGPGIPRGRRRKLFEPSKRTRADGAGLGLAIGRRFIEASGGSIEFETTPGGGAAFVIRLPAVATTDTDPV